MKINLFDSRGRQLLPISMEKAQELIKQGKVKPVSKNPPTMKLKEDTFASNLSHIAFLLFKKHDKKAIALIVAVVLCTLALVGGVLALLHNKHEEANEPEMLIEPTQETQQIITETTKPTTTTTTTTTTVAPETSTTTTTKPTTTQTTTKQRTEKPTQRQTTKKETTKKPTTKKQTQKPTKSNGLPSPASDDDELPSPARDSDELPIL